jgi:ribosome-associated protein
MELARSIVNTLEEKKGENIILMDIRELAVFADYFVICSGTSDRMLQALADAVREHAHQAYGLSTRTEGRSQDGWMLVDLGDVIVHLFSPDRRNYYRLEELWSRGKILLRLQ